MHVSCLSGALGRTFSGADGWQSKINLLWKQHAAFNDKCRFQNESSKPGVRHTWLSSRFPQLTISLPHTPTHPRFNTCPKHVCVNVHRYDLHRMAFRSRRGNLPPSLPPPVVSNLRRGCAFLKRWHRAHVYSIYLQKLVNIGTQPHGWGAGLPLDTRYTRSNSQNLQIHHYHL